MCEAKNTFWSYCVPDGKLLHVKMMHLDTLLELMLVPREAVKFGCGVMMKVPTFHWGPGLKSW
jgi:hypothetical protein